MQKENIKKIYTLNADVLQRGDIILTTEKHKISNLIRVLTLGPYSHAMIYLGVHTCADAAGPDTRVASHNIQRIFFENTKHCCVVRLKEELSELQLDNIVDSARRMIGMEYSIEEAKLVLLRVRLTAKEINRQFCSRYVAQAYENSGFQLVRNSDYCSPADIYRSHLVQKVNNHLRIASCQELEVFQKISKPLEAKDYADKYKFSNAKKISGYDIQTDEQFNYVLLKHPELDSQFSTILTESGFLKLWEIEKSENPWYYNFDLLKEKYPDNKYLQQIGWMNIPIEHELQRGFNLTLHTLENSYKYQQLMTLKIQIDLYQTLISLSKTREGLWEKCTELSDL